MCGNLNQMHFKCKNGANRYVDFFFFFLNGMVCRFESFQAMLNPVFKATQRAMKVGAG